jgi:hypothetical protein
VTCQSQGVDRDRKGYHQIGQRHVGVDERYRGGQQKGCVIETKALGPPNKALLAWDEAPVKIRKASVKIDKTLVKISKASSSHSHKASGSVFVGSSENSLTAIFVLK